MNFTKALIYYIIKLYINEFGGLKLMALEGKPDFIKIEKDILDFWEENKCFEKLMEKNKNGERFRFLDGPITANNPMGVHHAWGRSRKDTFLRYKAMNGHSCLYRNGFDAQGLWVEVEVEKELGFKNKKDIENYGLDKFTRKCEDRVERFSSTIIEQSKRLGQWMNWKNSYFTHTDENISGIWHFLKVCHEKGWIERGSRPMPWCPRCGTSLSDHEMAGSHKDITHKAVFCIAKIKDADFDMLVWTTTPWTLSANVALAVNPELDYAIVKCENFEKPFALAKNAIKYIEGEKQVLKIIKGSEFLGLEYETFFPWFKVQKEFTHKVIAWEDVDANEGCGVVHIAPGCGAEDYELGKKYNLPEICPINEIGAFEENYDFLSGKTTAEARDLVFESLEKQGKLFKVHDYTHSYPVCWRCKTEIVFRLVKEWYIKTEEIKPQLLKAASEVDWQPAFIGKRMQDWLTNMGNWNISRKRYYGLPLPFYPCECGHLTVVGSKEELLELSIDKNVDLPELHRPWIDKVKIKCPHCQKEVSRVPDIGDVWLDAGIVPFSTLGYFKDREEWKKNFPAQWVTEMHEQIRLWFYSLLFMSVTLTGKAPYEKVQSYGKVVAEDGTKFSKTGFMIKFDEAADKIGADAVRYLFAASPTNNDVRFGFAAGEEARRKLLGFWNIYSFFMTYAEIDKPEIKDEKSENLVDIWLRNRVDSFISKAKKSYEEYSTSEIIKEFESCIDDVSNWYVRINRRRFWKNSIDSDKQSAYNTLYYAIKRICQVMAPIVPFMAEYIWQNMIRKYENAPESVHLSDFPAAGEFDEKVLKETEEVREIVNTALKLRNEQNIKVKQPLAVLYIGKCFEKALAYEKIIKEELNVKNIVVLEDFKSLKDNFISLDFKVAGRALKADLNKVKNLCDSLSEETKKALALEVKEKSSINLPGYGEISSDCFAVVSKDKEGIAADGELLVALDVKVTPELKAEGIYREILRHCQVLRKEAGFEVSDRVTIDFETQSEKIKEVLKAYEKNIAQETLSEIKEIAEPRKTKEVSVDGESLTMKIK